MWQIEPTTSSVLALAAIVKAGEVADRSSAIQALGHIGPTAAIAVPVVIESLKSKSLIDSSVEALRQIGPGAMAAVPALIDMLIKSQDASVGFSMSVAEAAMTIGLRPAIVPRLTAALGNNGSGVRMTAMLLLGKMGAAARPAVPALARIFRDGKNNEWSQAGGALSTIGPAAGEAVPLLIEVFEDIRRSNYSRIFALQLLRDMGTAALPAVPALRKVEGNRVLGDYAKQALMEIECHSAPK